MKTCQTNSTCHSKFILKILRGSPGAQYWEEFELAQEESCNVILALMKIQRNPVNKEGKRVTPVAWEMGCLEEVCGSCSMLINGRPRQACAALIEDLITENTTITLAPLTKFPLARDLMVDRSSMFESLKKVHAWIEVDSSYNRDEHIVVSQEKQEVMYSLSTCMTCGCCSEACPQVNEKSSFMGPAAVSQVRLFNAHPIGKLQRSKRLKPMMEEGGIIGCGNAQNCVRVCPKKIPLTDSIAAIFRDTMAESFKQLFSFPDR